MDPAKPKDSGIWTWTVQSANELFDSRADKCIQSALEAQRGSWSPLDHPRARPGGTSRSFVLKLIKEGQLTINGIQNLNPSTTLHVGDTLSLRFAPTDESAEAMLKPETRSLEVLYEDEDLLIINKPQGLTVHPSETQKQNTLVHALLGWINEGRLKQLSQVGGPLRPGIVHRLDQNTSGSLVLAKTDEAHRKMSALFAAHDPASLDRRYWALCFGSPASNEFTIRGTLGRSPKDRKKMSTQVSESKGGRTAITHVRVIEKFGPLNTPFASLLELRLQTGRTHQIRVHLTAEGVSVLGDPTYGTPTETQGKWTRLPKAVKEKVMSLQGQALHAWLIQFKHPITGKLIRVEATPPQDYSELLELLRQNSDR